MMDVLPIAAIWRFRSITMFPAGIVVNTIDSVAVAYACSVNAFAPARSIVMSGLAFPPIENTFPHGT